MPPSASSKRPFFWVRASVKAPFSCPKSSDSSSVSVSAVHVMCMKDPFPAGPSACNVRAMTPLFEAHMARLAEHPNIGEVRGKGLMGALEAVRDKATKTPFDGSLSVSERIANTCTDHGLICRPLGQAIVLCPPFIITDAQMDELFDKLGAALGQVFAELG